MGIYQVTAPTVDPVSLLEAKKQCEIAEDITAHDTYLHGLIATARACAEDDECKGLQCVMGTYDFKLDAFPADRFIVIPRAPLISVTSLTYVDSDGTVQTFGGSPVSQYSVDCKSPHVPEYGEIHLAYGESWPATRAEHNAVRIRFQCGFGATAAFTPAAVKQWMLLLIGTMFSHREIEVTGAIVSELGFARHLLNNYRIRGSRVA